MRKSLTYKVLAAVMAAGSLGLYAATPAAAEKIFNAPEDGTIVNENFDNVYGNGTPITITGGTIGYVYGVGEYYYNDDASGGNVSINGNAEVTYVVYGGRSYSGRSYSGEAYNNTVNISGGSVGDVRGGYSGNGEVYDNTVNISGIANVTGDVCGGRSYSGEAYNNTVNISGGSVKGDVYGGYSYGYGQSISREAYDNIVNISGGSVKGDVYGGYSYGYGQSISREAYDNIVNISGGSVTGKVYGGNSESREAHHNTVNISGDAKVIVGTVYGGWSDSGSANDNTVNISGGSVKGNVYGGYSESGSAKDNQIIIRGFADITNANLFGYGGYGTNATGNTLTIDGWSDSTQSVKNFSDIAFKNIDWNNNESILTITNQNGYTSDLTNTKIKTINIAGGSNINVGESMTLIESKNSNDLGLTEGNVTDTFTAGVAREGLGSTRIDGNVVTFNIDSIKLSSQAVSAAQTRAASAAFVNQGTDLISDSLDTLSRDDNYGVKTFAAVHGNRSKYDVADDIKINGWSTIVGVGNADKFDNGSEFSWGVFYENGSGNYRTYNSFNNEFFRGDGSMVYNGGGIAARYENKNGVYTEGSLRAGMLKNELDNAMRNVNGSYGYETESAYYGAHIGVGKIISLSDSSDLDIYGKFFHTYTEGDSVTIADDKFDFDSITSDRLRVGARITSNKENKFSTYYGLAYEYEFNGDADMTAQGLRADTQSLQGSSVMAELGFNYQPTPDSPWSFDLNMRGYTGERQGGSFNVQATYTF